MQYIQKQNQPPGDWDAWFSFTNGNGEEERSFDYGKHNSSLKLLKVAKRFLIEEQNGLCAFCQKSISLETASIEHIIPKSFNKELSTNYFNLVAVCEKQDKDPVSGKQHCDKEKQSNPITPLIFLSNCQVTEKGSHPFFKVKPDGEILPKENLPEEIKSQVDAFLKITNLNHSLLKAHRTKDVLDGIIAAYQHIGHSAKTVRDFRKFQFERILSTPNQPFRQFLLIYFASKLGIN